MSKQPRLLNQSDRDYWLAWEPRVEGMLVDLAERGFVCERHCYTNGFTDDPRCRIRPAVADALERAREALPTGYNFRIHDAWRPWVVQERLATKYRVTIAEAHPGWSKEQVEAELVILAPPIRVLPSFDSHRYGGAVDLTILDAGGQALDMGTPLPYMAGPEAGLLFFETAAETPQHRLFRENRRLLIRVMHGARFLPNLDEWWHWGFASDVRAEGLI
ncbi:MAG: M15 family metallopeptidase [Planctomycetota bacterium]